MVMSSTHDTMFRWVYASDARVFGNSSYWTPPTHSSTEGGLVAGSTVSWMFGKIMRQLVFGGTQVPGSRLDFDAQLTVVGLAGLQSPEAGAYLARRSTTEPNALSETNSGMFS